MHVLYNYGAGGYRVHVMGDDGQIAAEYAGGNSPFEGGVRLDTDDPYALSLSDIRWAAVRTARDMAKEAGLRARDVSRDTDIDPE